MNHFFVVVVVAVFFFAHGFHEAMFTNLSTNMRNMNHVRAYFALIIKWYEAKASI